MHAQTQKTKFFLQLVGSGIIGFFDLVIVKTSKSKAKS